jgi:magnesium transporter
VFLPLSFVTGFFGRNFGWMVRNNDSFAVFLIIGVGGLVVSAAALYAWFSRSGLIARAERCG